MTIISVEIKRTKFQSPFGTEISTLMLALPLECVKYFLSFCGIALSNWPADLPSKTHETRNSLDFMGLQERKARPCAPRITLGSGLLAKIGAELRNYRRLAVGAHYVPAVRRPVEEFSGTDPKSLC